jgi:hypothetical protein
MQRQGSFSGPVAKFFRVRFVRELRSAELVVTQLEVAIRPSRNPAHNQKLGYPVFPRSSHTGQENFATGPFSAPPQLSIPDSFR